MTFFTKNLVVYPHPTTGTFESLNVSPLNDSLVMPPSVLSIMRPLNDTEGSITTETLSSLEGIKCNVQSRLDSLNASLSNVSSSYWSMHGSLEDMIGGSFSSASFGGAVSMNNCSVVTLSAVNVSMTNASFINIDTTTLNVNGQRAATVP